MVPKAVEAAVTAELKVAPEAMVRLGGLLTLFSVALAASESVPPFTRIPPEPPARLRRLVRTSVPAPSLIRVPVPPLLTEIGPEIVFVSMPLLKNRDPPLIVTGRPC